MFIILINPKYRMFNQKTGTIADSSCFCHTIGRNKSITPLIIKNKKDMEDSNFRKGDAKTAIYGSEKMLQASPVDKIPDGPTTPEIAYQMVKDETFAQTQPRLKIGRAHV